MAFDPKSLIDKTNATCRRALQLAAEYCASQTHYDVEVEHFLFKLLDQPNTDLHHLLRYYDIDVDRVRADLTESLENLKRGNGRTPSLSPNLMTMFQEGWMFSTLIFKENFIRSGALLPALLETPRLRANLPHGPLLDIDRDRLRREAPELVRASDEEKNKPVAAPVTHKAAPGQAAGAVADQEQADLGPSNTPNLDMYSTDLTAQARAGEIDEVVARDEEIRAVIDILTRRRQNNPILVGEAGVGKTAVVEGLAKRIASGDVPPPLKNVSLRALDLGLLQAGAGVRGEFENRLKNLINEVKTSLQPIVLFIDEAHSLIGAGGSEGSGDAANLIKPALARGELRTIGSTTWSEYKKYIEKDAALTRRFQPVPVKEPSEEKAVRMLRAVAPHFEKHHGVRIDEEALHQAVKLSHRYLIGRFLPDKAVSVLDTACARVALSQSTVPGPVESVRRQLEDLEREEKRLTRETLDGRDHEARLQRWHEEREAAEKEKERLEALWAEEMALVKSYTELRAKEDRSEEETTSMHALLADLERIQGEEPMVSIDVEGLVVASVVASWTGVPVGKMLKDDIRKVLELQAGLGDRVIGQDHGLAEISRRIRSSKADLVDPGKPVGVFLLVGPSGVGKTETALALADLMYGGEHNVITVNMSEYQEAHTVSTLRGAPPGYVGYGKGGVLTEAVRRSPYSVILLDEIEKAHNDVLEVFFQVFDKGYMEDGEGTHINFKNTIILLTSNVGGDTLMDISQNERPSVEAAYAQIYNQLHDRFPAAFLGRLAVIPYYPLFDEQLEKIVRLKLNKITKRFRHAHHAELCYPPELVSYVVSRCNDAESGARIIDNILNSGLVPDLSLAVLERIADEAPFTLATVTIEDNRFKVSFENNLTPET